MGTIFPLVQTKDTGRWREEKKWRLGKHNVEESRTPTQASGGDDNVGNQVVDGGNVLEMNISPIEGAGLITTRDNGEFFVTEVISERALVVAEGDNCMVGVENNTEKSEAFNEAINQPLNVNSESDPMDQSTISLGDPSSGLDLNDKSIISGPHPTGCIEIISDSGNREHLSGGKRGREEEVEDASNDRRGKLARKEGELLGSGTERVGGIEDILLRQRDYNGKQSERHSGRVGFDTDKEGCVVDEVCMVKQSDSEVEGAAGAGIAGLATAVALKRVGIRALVLERFDGLRATGAALTLFPNTWLALNALGVSHNLSTFYAPCKM
ncbi:hypothetical protein EZV62_015077 [Acer yangbiense]|uniref:FAD-binding domain-containing protein n=1 Tax=Acer yangbiense TaxID=1000413 RepID=A0A5C7HUP0_9ROSI|nr:hypothetical protein EZV62_015077 [Acer yangbiense]